MRPLGNKVIVLPQEDRQTRTGIVLPQSATGDVGRGVVVATGHGAVTMSGDIIPMEVSKGDKVLFPRSKGVPLEGEEGEVLLIFYETDLYCIL